MSHHLTTGLLALTVAGGPALAQAPAAEETATGTVVSNAYYRATVSHERGGFISEIALDDRAVVMGEHALYTDRGIYGDGTSVTSAKESNPQVEISRQEGAITITSRGTLRGPDDLAEPKRRLDYTVAYLFDESPTIGASWSVTPGFAMEDVTGFFSYIMHVPRYAEWFARTVDGVVFQPASGVNGRCYQSALEPLALRDPWMGLLLPDGGIIALSEIQAEPAFGNVFMHESEAKDIALFCAWFSGPAASDFVAGEPWSGSFRLQLWPRDRQQALALPAFLG